MQYIQQIFFVAIAIAAIYLFSKKALEIKRNIFLGREEDLNTNSAQGWKNILLLAFGQKKMFKNPLVAVMHFFVYAGFIIINIEIVEIILDGVGGTHRLFASPLGNVYTWLINAFEILAILVLVFCVVFLIRRNIIKLKRFASNDLNGWPRSDANYINFAISSFLHPVLQNFSNEILAVSERICWWLHIIGIFAFANYLPYSKHLHIILAFPNAYFAKTEPQGKMQNMPEIQNEVLYSMQPELAPTGDAAAPIKKFGAKDVFDLNWKNLLDAYSCTECGRCTAACPANITGKLLSPRSIMMKTRDRLEEVGRNINNNKTFTEDHKTLLRDYISEEELRACTTCNACVEECPVSISPLDIILQLRRYLIMEESSAPQEWNSTFSNMENNFAPWKFSPDERDRWAEEMADVG